MRDQLAQSGCNPQVGWVTGAGRMHAHAAQLGTTYQNVCRVGDLRYQVCLSQTRTHTAPNLFRTITQNMDMNFKPERQWLARPIQQQTSDPLTHATFQPQQNTQPETYNQQAMFCSTAGEGQCSLTQFQVQNKHTESYSDVSAL